MNIFVTGGTGFIGKKLVEALSKEGHDIFVLVRNEKKALAIFSPKKRIFPIEGALEKPESYRHVFGNSIEAVFHLAAIPGEKWGYQKKDYEIINWQATKWLLDECEGKIRRFIFCSSINAIDNQSQFSKIPSLHAQRKIASILSAYDDLIKNNTRRIAILEEMARRIYEEWFVNFRFPGHEKVKMVESELGLIPQHWTVRKASDAISINPPTKVPKTGEKPFVPMTCLLENSMLVLNTEMREGNSGAKFQNGDTLFARITPCLENGKTGYVQFLPPDQPVAFGSTEFIVLRSRTLSPEIVYLMARSSPFRDNAIKSMSGATGRQRVREACFDTFTFPHAGQDLITKFSDIVRPMFELIYSLSKKNANLRATRDLLLPKLISGEIDVSQALDVTEKAAVL